MKSTFPNKEELQKIRDTYKPGTLIELEKMDDPYTSLKAGNRGTVDFVDDAGQIHMKWETGSSLAVIPGVDVFRIVSE